MLDEQITIIPHTSRRWRMGTAGAALILASLLSLVTLQREDAAAQDTQTPAAAPNAARASDPTDSERTEEEAETTHTTVGVGQNGLAAVGIAGEAAYEGANTISVRCIDESRAPLEGVEATLYRVWYRDGKHERVAMSTSGSNGEATFMNVVPVDRVEQYNAMLTARQHQDLFATHILVVTGRVGLATALVSAAEYEVGRQGYAAEVTLGPGQKLAGRVIAPDGSPVAGALVAAGAMANVTIDGVNAVRTDADGRYEFDDRPRYEAAAAREQRPRINSFSYTAGDESEGTGYRSTRPKRQPVPADLWASQLTISHPDYAVTRAPGGDIPGRVDVRMQPAAAIAGRVKTIAGAPAADMLVRAYSHSDMEIADEGSVVRRTGDFTLAHGGGHAAAARTNADGAYRMTSLPEGVYDVWVETTTTGDPRSGLTNTGIAELTVPASSGATVAPDLVVGPGVLLRGQILDGATGGPLRLPNGARATVIPNYVGGPRMQDQPSSEVIVTADGKFEARMAPGKAHLTVLVVVLGREAEHSP